MVESDGVRGVIRGQTIVLERAARFPEGQLVTVIIYPVPPEDDHSPGAGLRRAFGGWSDDPEGLEEFLKQVRRDRDADRRAEPLE